MRIRQSLRTALGATHLTSSIARFVLAASSVMALVAFLALARRYSRFTVDDAYITLRYAKHLAEGLGPEWNPGGAPTEGYTSPLWMAVLSLPHLVGLDALVVAKVLGSLAAVAAAAASAALARAATGALSRQASACAAALAALLVLLERTTALHAISGMETTLFAALLTTLFALAAGVAARASSTASRATATTRHAVWLGVVGLASGLTRPEGNLAALVAITVALAMAPASGRLRLAARVALVYAVPGALYFAWRWAHYGQLFPLPFYVKVGGHGTTLAGWDEGVAFAHTLTMGRPWVGIPLVAGAVAFRRPLAPALGAIGLLFACSLVLEPIMAYEHRFLYALLPALYAITAAGAVQLAVLVGARLRRRMRARSAEILGACAVSLAAALFGAEARLRAGASIAEWTSYGDGLARAHLALGRALARLRPSVERPVIALVDVGAVAYTSEWTTVDTFGLNDAVVARAKTRNPAYVLGRDPTLIVLISAKREPFVPHLAWEQGLHDAALARGYVTLGSYVFDETYFLRVLAKPGTLAAGDLFETPSAGAQPAEARALVTP